HQFVRHAVQLHVSLDVCFVIVVVAERVKYLRKIEMGQSRVDLAHVRVDLPVLDNGSNWRATTLDYGFSAQDRVDLDDMAMFGLSCHWRSSLELPETVAFILFCYSTMRGREAPARSAERSTPFTPRCSPPARAHSTAPAPPSGTAG